MNSPIRWAGGKRWLAERLSKEIIESDPTVYVEPFLGGAAIALSIPSYITKVLSDVNPTLIDFWLCVQRAPTALIDELGRVEYEFGNDQTGYLAARSVMNSFITDARPLWIRRAALFLYLNARCFNGLWRTNGKGLFNVPYGKLERPSSIDHREAQAISQWSQSAKFECAEFNKTSFSACCAYRKRVAVYADPPYHDAFEGYAKDGFGESNQRELAEELNYAVRKGAKIWTTNSDTPFIREIYSWTKIEETYEQHSVGATGDRRGKRSCLLIRGG